MSTREDPPNRVDHDDEEHGGRPADDSVAEAVGRGRWWATPFVLVGSVAFLVWTAAALIAAIALLAWWLA